MASIVQLQEGERSILPPPFGGEMAVKTGTLGPEGVPVVLFSLLRGGFWPPLRLPSSDLSLFVHKGQGRAEVAGQSRTIVPGVTVTVPQGQWFSLRNTGTGLLQLVCAFSSAAPIRYFQALAQGAAAADSRAVELRQAKAAVSTGEVFPPQSAATPVSPASSPVRRRRHRRHRGRTKAVLPAQAAASPPSLSQAAASPPASSAAPAGRQQPPARASSAGKRGRPRPGRRGFVKEVFMNGKWVRISGEGPVVASGDS